MNNPQQLKLALENLANDVRALWPTDYPDTLLQKLQGMAVDLYRDGVAGGVIEPLVPTTHYKGDLNVWESLAHRVAEIDSTVMRVDQAYDTVVNGLYCAKDNEIWTLHAAQVISALARLVAIPGGAVPQKSAEPEVSDLGEAIVAVIRNAPGKIRTINDIGRALEAAKIYKNDSRVYDTVADLKRAGIIVKGKTYELRLS